MKGKKNNIGQLVKECWPTVPNDEIDAAGRRVWTKLVAEMAKHDLSNRSLYEDFSTPILKPREFQVLNAVAHLQSERAPGNLCDIHETVEEWNGRVRPISVSWALRRLEKQGFVRVRELPLTGKPSKAWPRFEVTEEGERALAEMRGETVVLREHEKDLGLAEGAPDSLKL